MNYPTDHKHQLKFDLILNSKHIPSLLIVILKNSNHDTLNSKKMSCLSLQIENHLLNICSIFYKNLAQFCCAFSLISLLFFNLIRSNI